MNKQLLRVYLFITVIVVVLLYLFDGIYDLLVDNQSNYQVPIEKLIALAQQQQMPTFDYLTLQDLHLPEDLHQQLLNQQVIAVKTADNQHIFFQLQGKRVISYGPFSGLSSIENDTANFIQLLFFIALAIAFLLVLIPIARDIVKVQKAAERFSKKPRKLQIDIDKNSVIYPISQSVTSMSDRIVDSIKVQQDLAITVAHEVRTPLSRLRFIQKQIENNISEKNNIRIIRDIEEINTLVSDYLTYSKLDENTSSADITKQPLSELSDLIDEKFDIYRANFTIEINCQQGESHFDLQLMAIALQNLLMNGMRYTKSTLVVELANQGSNSVIKVRDDGNGIGGKRAAIVEQFMRNAKNQHDFGFGLGLYITHLIVTKHGGKLSIDNDDELGGAIFTISWPIVPSKKLLMQQH